MQKAEVFVQNIINNLVQGVITSYSFDTSLKQKIAKFERLVNTQQFTVLDSITKQLDDYNWQVEGKDWTIFDFQVFNMKDISFRIENTNAFSTVDFIAELKFLSSAQGGRKTSVDSGYRPHIVFEDYPEQITSGKQTYLGQETVTPGEIVLAEISILSKALFSNLLYENMKFKFYEGAHKMGSGKILEIVNENLKVNEK